MLSILAMVFGGIGVPAGSIVLGLVAIVLAFIARSRHERLSSTAMKVAIGGTLVGFTLGLLIATA